MKEKSEKAGLTLNTQKTKIMAFGPITSWQIDGETMETVRDFKKKKKKLFKCIHLIVFQNIYVLLYNKYFQTKSTCINVLKPSRIH